MPPAPPKLDVFSNPSEGFCSPINNAAPLPRPGQGKSQLQTMPIHNPLVPHRLNGIAFPNHPPPPPPPPPISSPSNFRSFRSPNKNNSTLKPIFGNVEGPKIRFHSSIKHASIEGRVSNIKEIIPIPQDQQVENVKNDASSDQKQDSPGGDGDKFKSISEGKPSDIVESIDMEMSDEEEISQKDKSPEKLLRNNQRNSNNVPPPSETGLFFCC